MNIDWKLVFEGIRAVFEPLATASWPIAFGIIAWIYKDNIGNLLSRIRTVRGLGAEADIQPLDGRSQQGQNPEEISNPLSKSNQIIINPAGGTLSRMPPPHELYDLIGQKTLGDLQEIFSDDQESKLNWAVRLYARAEIERLHEFHYRVIFGSQLQALKELNQLRRARADKFEHYYNAAKETEAGKVVLENTDFEKWGQFLIDIGYVVWAADNDEEVLITAFGIDFITWIAGRGISEYRIS